MMKRVIVAGCNMRGNYDDYNGAKEFIEICIKKIREKYTLVFLSGGCKGADKLGERYAIENGFPIEYYPAHWKRYGKSAGPKRNLQMAEVCDYVSCVCTVGMGKVVEPLQRIRNLSFRFPIALKLNKPLKVKII